MAFCQEIGIDCVYVVSDDYSHAWNMVLMDDGHWWYVDVTFDDSISNKYGYFLLNDSMPLKNSPACKDMQTGGLKADGTYYEKNRSF